MSREEQAKFFGIDWNSIIQKRGMSEMFVAPFLCEAGSLLFGAAKLWDGRIRADEIFQFAFMLNNEGWSKGGNALRFSGDESCNESLLTDAYGGRWNYIAQSETKEGRNQLKNSESAIRMTEASFLLISNALVILHKIPDLSNHNLAKYIEDKIEILSESPWAHFDCKPLSFNTHQALIQRSILKMCECLCYTGANLWRNKGLDNKLYPFGKKDAQKWLSRGLEFREISEKQYMIFVNDNCIKENERENILDARNDSPLNMFDDVCLNFYHEIKDVRNCEKIINLWIDTLYFLCEQSNKNNNFKEFLALP